MSHDSAQYSLLNWLIVDYLFDRQYLVYMFMAHITAKLCRHMHFMFLSNYFSVHYNGFLSYFYSLLNK